MKLNLKRLFARSMTGGLDLVGPPVPPSARSGKRKIMFITLAGMLAVIGAVAGAYYFAMRPVTLRIAVGPASSDDVKVVQALTQAFAQTHGYVRLRPIQTDGATASAQALADGKADLAIIRGDLDVPKNAQAVATLRKNVAVLWVPPAAKGKGKKSGAKITKIPQLAGHRVGVVGRTQANVNLLKLILQQYAVDPGKVDMFNFQRTKLRTPFATRERMPTSPPDRSTARSPPMRSRRQRATAALRLSWPSIRPRRLRKTTPCTKRPKFQPAPLAGRPTSQRMK
jgi:succinate dehydrogenase hydrophobic anchor subunit